MNIVSLEPKDKCAENRTILYFVIKWVSMCGTSGGKAGEDDRGNKAVTDRPLLCQY